MNNIIFTVEDNTGVITLNRPQALNALNLEMVYSLKEQLQQWEQDSAVEKVIIKSALEKAFCAGGDIRAIYEAKEKINHGEDVEFFKEEYLLNRIIKHYKKPYIAIMNGITMGGGVGISIHGSKRIAHANLIFAMPETSIGFFPDIGGSFFLSHAPGYLGFYLGLTGEKINATEALYAGFVDEIIGEASSHNHLKEQRKIIDDCFSAETIEEILSRLEKTNSPWSLETIKVLQQKSPISLKVTLRALQRGKNLTFDECMTMEDHLAKTFAPGHDFYEGIRAMIIDKDKKPRWQPNTLAEVTDAMVEKHF